MTKEELAERYPTYLTVGQSNFTVTLWKDLEVAATYPIAVGAPAYPTPDGLFSVEQQAGRSGLERSQLRMGGRARRDHGRRRDRREPAQVAVDGRHRRRRLPRHRDTGSIGTAASHGCMRMNVSDIEALYDQVPVGTPVYIG